uniref:Cytochrome b n=1 Tax=Romanomermis iyengari TaxID=416168 RepID=A1Z3B4_ROMIY|nr:cytochrome b [Romanomermis iyengari]ABL73798.1 cytochrome b [Romanomermis iyengari]
MNKNFKISLFSPLNLSYWWNLGSLLLMLILIQILSGVMLSLFYENSMMSFTSLWVIHMEIFNGSLIHYIHLNFASFLFMVLYFHMVKALLYNSYLNLKFVWLTGWLMMILFMMIAFLGYVLPWGQMSLWGATVITNLLSTLPFGNYLVQWIWGGYFVSNITLKLFFSLHFLFPLLTLTVIALHMITLHYYGSSNPLGTYNNIVKSEFSLNYLVKDLVNIILLLVFIIFSLLKSFNLSDPENFIMANSLVSPIHIQPEWYFLQYYAILRAIPSKVGGVIIFVLSLVMIASMILFKNLNSCYTKMNLFMMLVFMIVNIILMWLGGQVVEEPYLTVSQFFSFLYFMWFLVLGIMMKKL